MKADRKHMTNHDAGRDRRSPRRVRSPDRNETAKRRSGATIRFSDRERSIAAYHEAGQAVAALALGWRVDRAGIFAKPVEIDGETAGGVCTSRLACRRPTIGRALDRLVISAAGLAAQRRHAPRSSRMLASRDRQQAETLTLFSTLAPGSDATLHRLARAEAAGLIAMKWGLVETLARRFLERDTPIGGATIAKIVKTFDMKMAAELDAMIARCGMPDADAIEAWREKRQRSARAVSRRHLGEAALLTIGRLISIEGPETTGDLVHRALQEIASRRGLDGDKFIRAWERALAVERRRWAWRAVSPPPPPALGPS